MANLKWTRYRTHLDMFDTCVPSDSVHSDEMYVNVDVEVTLDNSLQN